MPDKLLADLFIAYYDARRNKRNSINALEFEINYYQNLWQLYQELKTGTYQIGRSVAFVVFDPVQREIIASPFRDRVIHHLLFNYINPLFEPLFINDSYSCRQGRGTSCGIKRVAHFIRSCSHNYRQNCFILKLDMAGYFMSINHRVLYAKVKGYLSKHNDKINFDLNLVLDLLQKIIFHHYTANCILRGSPHDWRGLPKNKSLFYAPPGFGLPIGNLTSQLFSNIYLNDFDHYIKRQLKFKYYGRYVDDIIIVHPDKARLKIAINDVRNYLAVNLGLRIHPRKIYLQPYHHGVDFLGALIRPYRQYVRRRTKNNFFKTIAKVNQTLSGSNITQEKLTSILASFNSYLGLVGQYSSFNLRHKSLTARLSPIFWQFFRRGGGRDNYRKVILRKL